MDLFYYAMLQTWEAGEKAGNEVGNQGGTGTGDYAVSDHAVCLFEDHIDIRWKFADLFEQLGMNGSLEKEHTNDR